MDGVTMVSEFAIGDWNPAESRATYFIADIAANHDGELDRAIDLIHLSAEAGANAAKFQNFAADQIVSDKGFQALGQQVSHQADWPASVHEIYEKASIPYSWTPELVDACENAGVDYFSAPYDLHAIEHLIPYVSVFKAGSGVLHWHELLAAMAETGKPIILSTGASTLGEVVEAVEVIQRHGAPLSLLQCNTNYTGAPDNFDHLNLRVIETYQRLFPDAVIGFSDHTGGSTAPLGAVALGARIVEKHFTDDTTREGPDHPFAMDAPAWRAMVDSCRQLEAALGDGLKRVAGNETETRVIQRPCLRAAHPLESGHVVSRDDLTVLRPATPGAITPDRMETVLGMTLARDLEEQDALFWGALVDAEETPTT